MKDGVCPYCGGDLILVNPGINDEKECDTCEYHISASGEEYAPTMKIQLRASVFDTVG